jgi:hypothetical protein
LGHFGIHFLKITLSYSIEKGLKKGRVRREDPFDKYSFRSSLLKSFFAVVVSKSDVAPASWSLHSDIKDKRGKPNRKKRRKSDEVIKTKRKKTVL